MNLRNGGIGIIAVPGLIQTEGEGLGVELGNRLDVPLFSWSIGGLGCARQRVEARAGRKVPAARRGISENVVLQLNEAGSSLDRSVFDSEVELACADFPRRLGGID